MGGALAFDEKKTIVFLVANNHGSNRPILHFGGLTRVGFRCLTVEPRPGSGFGRDPLTTAGGNLGPVPRSLLIPFLSPIHLGPGGQALADNHKALHAAAINIIYS
jgi:hypothetical protein